jgi:hypothetical protein
MGYPATRSLTALAMNSKIFVSSLSTGLGIIELRRCGEMVRPEILIREDHIF